jgi:hypothetical protein
VYTTVTVPESAEGVRESDVGSIPLREFNTTALNNGCSIPTQHYIIIESFESFDNYFRCFVSIFS